MGIACKYCIATKGITLKDVFDTEDELCEHIEKEHHIAVRREGESEEGCMERFKRENPEAGGPSCKCPSCQNRQDVLRLLESLGAKREYRDN